MELRFWGVRGSIATPAEHTLGVGGNITCLSLLSEEHLFGLDAGTGIRRLGEHLESHDTASWRGSISWREAALTAREADLPGHRGGDGDDPVQVPGLLSVS